MQLERVETPGIAHYAYVIAEGGEAAVVDPARHAQPYLEAARRLGSTIRYVVETHRQEDFVMGAAYLASRTGASIVNGSHELFGHGDLRLADGGTFRIGNLTVRALHTPGHTPESMSYAVYSGAVKDCAWCVFTGDALFFGTTGRTDLADASKSADNAAQLYDSVHTKLSGLGDTALVLPAHGPGSVCGSGMAERPYSTLGDERRYNEVFVLDRAEFARRKGGQRLPRPPYFRHMERVNLAGGLAPTIRPGVVPLLGVDEFAEAAGREAVFDTREPEGFAAAHIDGSCSIWLGGLPVFGGWIADAESPVWLVTDRETDVDTAAMHLTRIGIDNVRGALAGGFGTWRSSGRPMGRSGLMTAREVADAGHGAQILDVRDEDEFRDGHIAGARHRYVGDLRSGVDDLGLDPDAPLVVTCSVGHRAGLAVSVLRAAGFADVRNLLGGMTAWRNLGLPTAD